MGRGGKSNGGSFVSTTSVKFNRSCPYCKNCMCIRQQRNCNNKDVFYENCIVFKGNNTLGLFMKQKKSFNSAVHSPVQIVEQREEAKPEEKVEVAQETSVDLEASEN